MGVIDDLISGQYRQGDHPAPHVPTRVILIEPDLRGMEADAIEILNFPAPIAVVSDDNTRRVLGDRIEAAAAQRGPIIPIHLPAGLHADLDTAKMVASATSTAGSILAVGSGTINDLCKYAAWDNNIECAVFATAPSMNGYTSVNSAITVDGLKKSLPTVAPVGIFMDLQILSDAPARMIRSGLGDSLCRSTAQADWLLAHCLHDSLYNDVPFDLLMTEEAGLFAKAEALMNNDHDAMGGLARTLILSGMGMTICGGSYPASQGEHLIGHYLEMMAPKAAPESFHGEQIAVATLVMARLQERMLAGAAPHMRASEIDEDAVIKHFGPAIGAACWQEYSAKCLDEQAADRLNDHLAEHWPEIVQRISAIIVPSEVIAAALKAAGAPTSYGDLGLNRDFFRDAVVHARTLRNRYTFLDLAGDSGMLEPDDLI